MNIVDRILKAEDDYIENNPDKNLATIILGQTELAELNQAFDSKNIYRDGAHVFGLKIQGVAGSKLEVVGN